MEDRVQLFVYNELSSLDFEINSFKNKSNSNRYTCQRKNDKARNVESAEIRSPANVLCFISFDSNGFYLILAVFISVNYTITCIELRNPK